jgi:hypothetical protein
MSPPEPIAENRPGLLLGPVLRHVGETDATIWVKLARPGTVRILDTETRTWSAGGHHFAMVIIEGLPRGASTEYQVELDGEVVWPPRHDDWPAPVIRTLGGGNEIRIAFGSCRYARADAVEDDNKFAPDSLVTLSRQLRRTPIDEWPHAMVMLGDQVYADETSEQVQDRLRQRRDVQHGAGLQVADFEEYTWLYDESWTDPDVRWLLSVLPSSMIFDDHDVRDDWNTSRSWREDMAREDWWPERIIGGLASYWIYQHLGNLSPAGLRESELFTAVTEHDGDVLPLLRDFAKRADRETDGAKGTRWSYCRDLGDVRLVMIDSRCGRLLDEKRSMVSHDEFEWISQQVTGDYDHLLVGTSLPWLLPRALHDLEAWNEKLASGARGARRAKWSESLRRAADLEHWAAFQESFDALGDLIQQVANGDRGNQPPASVCVLSGDVHHAYVARARFEPPTKAPVYQLTCSPLHNYVPTAMKGAFRLAWSRAAERTVRRVLALAGPVPQPSFGWTCEAGPFFGNELMTFTASSRDAQVEVARTTGTAEQPEFEAVARVGLSGGPNRSCPSFSRP